MKIEIKFRGKDIKDGKWVYGNFIRLKEGVYIIDDCDNFVIRYLYDEEALEVDTLDAIKVIPESVGQFTGLKDKTGREIYSGDIWKDDDGKIYEIDFCDGSFGAYKQGYFREAGLFIFGEIIGNKHDNPDLLKESQ